MKKFAILFAILLSFSWLKGQEIPTRISYQGKLYEDGFAVNGTKNITFTIGSWAEEHSSVLA